MNIDTLVAKNKHNIAIIKEDMAKPNNRHFRHPDKILHLLTLREIQLSDQLEFMKAKNCHSFFS